jgi:hypothetical protein
MKRIKKHYRGLGLTAIGVLSAAMTASGQTSPTTAAASTTGSQGATSATEDWIKKSKKPTDWMSWGADLRLRQEFVLSPNLVNVGNNEQNYERFRARIWTSVAPVEWMSLNARLAWEARNYLYPDNPTSNGVALDQWMMDEFLLDNLNVKITPPEIPVTFTLGRQDFMVAGKPEFGNGWLIGDGSPLDGSRTYYFDAARMTLDLKESKTQVNAMYVYQAGNEDAWLHPINMQDHRYYVSEVNEQSAILYVVNKSLPKTQFDGFFIYTHRDTVSDNARVVAQGDSLQGDMYTFGMRASGDMAEHWKYDVTIAPQFGTRANEDVHAFAGNGNMYYNFKDPHNNQLRAGIEYLSGDDPSTANNEGFDILWGRWPQWSELLVYQTVETGRKPSYWSNLLRPHIGYTINPVKKMEYTIDYSPIFAPENAAVAGITDSGFKGNFLQTVLKYTFNQHVRGHLWAEFFFPGDYYASSVYTENAMFLRAELFFTY